MDPQVSALNKHLTKHLTKHSNELLLQTPKET